MSPGVVKFKTQALQGGRPVKVMVEHEEREPVSRFVLVQMVLAASLLLAEAEGALREASPFWWLMNPVRACQRLCRRMQLLRERMEDAIARESR